MGARSVVQMIGNKDLQKLARLALTQGWVLTYRGNGHVRWQSPAGSVVFTGSTPGGGSAVANARSTLRRNGLVT
jgi:hypothetical protein